MSMVTWFHHAIFIMRYVWGIRFKINASSPLSMLSDRSIVMLMNHRSEFDWFYFFAYLGNVGLMNIRNVLKGTVRFVPFLGWCMQFATYIFLRRKWDADEPFLRNRFQLYARSKRNVWILIYPEGTNFSAVHKAKNDIYADKMGLKHTDFTLHPRTTGLHYLLSHIGQCHNADSRKLVDMTIAYRDDYPVEIRDLIIGGNTPAEVHLSHRVFYSSRTGNGAPRV
ncbi:hypothetical protein ACOME3_003197 [Neoechinorhynchus agilis]